jgi:hypothetical protein
MRMRTLGSVCAVFNKRLSVGLQNHYGILLRKGILMRFYKKLSRIQKRYKIDNETDLKHYFPSEYGWIIRCSDDHSNFIIQKCINNGNKVIEYRSAG